MVRQFQRARNVTVTYYFGLKGLIQSVQSVLDYLAIVKPGTAILIIRVRGWPAQERSNLNDIVWLSKLGYVNGGRPF